MIKSYEKYIVFNDYGWCLYTRLCSAGIKQKEYRSIPTKDQKIDEMIPPKEITPKTDPPADVKKQDSLIINPEGLFKDTNLYKRESNTEEFIIEGINI